MKIQKILQKIKRYFNTKRSIKHCGCACYCDCGEVLNVTAECYQINDEIYKYTCKNCKSSSYFHYGIAPVPILLKDFKENKI
jgi:hypothetical protein